MSSDRRLKIFIYARIVVTFLFLVSTLVLTFQDPQAIDKASSTGILRLMAFSFLFSAVSHFLLKFKRFHLFLTYLQTIWDLLFVTVLLLFTGGVESPYSFLYLLSIMNAGVLLGRREAIYTASLCGILYGGILDLQYFGLLEPLGLRSEAALEIGAKKIFYNIFLNLMGYYLTVIIIGYLSELAAEKEKERQEKSIDYEELQRLNSITVENIDSGLLTITPDLQIRVFNRYAEILTGVSRTDVYNLPLSDLFPALGDIAEGDNKGLRGEFVYQRGDGDSLVLGYYTLPFVDAMGNKAGIIINFKDLTSIKKMEEALKNADRMAALGELSARMAHEIRNPLAAMSGSVQLLAEHGSIVESDRRLLDIVLRESERLNGIITEFLVYAKPAAPKMEEINLKDLTEDMRLLVASDRRFEGICIVNEVSDGLVVNADSNQMRQVLLNLLHNSAEAMAGQEGTRCIKIAGEMYLSQQAVKAVSFATLSVTDNGPGISPITAAAIFEPFSTTKPQGTGLGLAISYRIMEAHNGSITCEMPSQGGCRFVVRLPVLRKPGDLTCLPIQP